MGKDQPTSGRIRDRRKPGSPKSYCFRGQGNPASHPLHRPPSPKLYSSKFRHTCKARTVRIRCSLFLVAIPGPHPGRTVPVSLKSDNILRSLLPKISQYQDGSSTGHKNRDSHNAKAYGHHIHNVPASERKEQSSCY